MSAWKRSILLLPNLSLRAAITASATSTTSASTADSLTHFVAGRVSITAINERLHASVRAGAEFREYFDTVWRRNLALLRRRNVTYVHLRATRSVAYLDPLQHRGR